jgi:hypothetical protein
MGSAQRSLPCRSSASSRFWARLSPFRLSFTHDKNVIVRYKAQRPDSKATVYPFKQSAEDDYDTSPQQR